MENHTEKTQNPTTSVGDILQTGNSPKKPKKISQERTVREEVRAPWVPLAQARKTISLLTLCTLALTLVTIILGALVFTQLTKKPWIVGYTNGKYKEMDPQNFKVTRDDVEIFLGDVIPRLYGIVQGEAPGLEMLGGSVNPNIVSTQRANVKKQSDSLKEQGISQFAIVTGIIPHTLVINRNERYIYAEVTGINMLTKRDKSTPTEAQWRCLLYIVDPLASMNSNTPGGRIAGNQHGLYLQQIVEQTPGTINTDSPRPTTEDEQERKEQELRRQRNIMPTLNLE